MNFLCFVVFRFFCAMLRKNFAFFTEITVPIFKEKMALREKSAVLLCLHILLSLFILIHILLISKVSVGVFFASLL